MPIHLAEAFGNDGLGHASAEGFVARPAEDGLGLRVPVDDPSFAIDADESIVGGIEINRGALGVFAQLFFGAAARRHVPEHALHAAHLAVGAQDRRLENLYVDHLAVGLLMLFDDPPAPGRS